jgi:electron transfer flavoprotein alpha subunit
MSQILVYIEHTADGITDLSLQTMAFAKQLAAGQNLSVEAMIAGKALGDRPAEVLSHGADEVFALEHDAFEHYLSAPTAEALCTLVQEKKPLLVLLPASTVGNDLAPITAGKLDAACVVDCDGVEFENGEPRFLRTEFDARARMSYAPTGTGSSFVTLKDGIADAQGPAEVTGKQTPRSVDLPDACLKSKIEKREVVQKTVNLKDASVIIGGGAGVGTADNFHLLETLAQKLNGEIGATRASVDAGWVSAERQIGQTGVTVRPDLYIACGISGAVQHSVGIRDAKTIVAINSDASAPIFRMAHYRLVGDLNDVVPKLVELLDA